MLPVRVHQNKVRLKTWFWGPGRLRVQIPVPQPTSCLPWAHSFASRTSASPSTRSCSTCHTGMLGGGGRVPVTRPAKRTAPGKRVTHRHDVASFTTRNEVALPPPTVPGRAGLAVQTHPRPWPLTPVPNRGPRGPSWSPGEAVRRGHLCPPARALYQFGATPHGEKQISLLGCRDPKRKWSFPMGVRTPQTGAHDRFSSLEALSAGEGHSDGSDGHHTFIATGPEQQTWNEPLREPLEGGTHRRQGGAAVWQ